MDPKIMLQGRLLPEVTTSSEIVHMEETRGANLYFNMCCVTLNNFDKTQHSSSLLCCRMHGLSDKHCQFKPVDILIPRIPGHCSLPDLQPTSQVCQRRVSYLRQLSSWCQQLIKDHTFTCYRAQYVCKKNTEWAKMQKDIAMLALICFEDSNLNLPM